MPDPSYILRKFLIAPYRSLGLLGLLLRLSCSLLLLVPLLRYLLLHCPIISSLLLRLLRSLDP